VPVEIGRAKDCIRRSDANALREVAHTLHGLIAIASTRAAALASALEGESANGDLEQAGGIVDRLAGVADAILEETRSVSVDGLRVCRDARS
jgi:hypothetical protein